MSHTKPYFFLLVLLSLGLSVLQRGYSQDGSRLVSRDDRPQSYIIPNLRAWGAVQKGLPVEKLEELLGGPIAKAGPFGNYKSNTLYSWMYGYVAKKSIAFPEDLAFLVRVERGRVWSKEDPFGGVPL